MSEQAWEVEHAREVYTAQALALIEAVESYESSHIPGTPCFEEALDLMRIVVDK